MKNFAAGLKKSEGSISVLLLACVILVLVLCLFMTDLGLYLSARNRAQDAADAAALAAVGEAFSFLSSGKDPTSAAKKLAGANGGEVLDVEISPGGNKVTVEVALRARSILINRLGIGPDRVTAKAAAEVDMDALLASGQIWYTGDPATMSLIRAALSSNSACASTMVVILALQHLGKPYVWGATGPNGFDCSGLVCYVFAQIGVRLPRVTFSQVRCGKAVPPGELAPGDLVFFRGNGHVGIYIGGGWFVHAPHTGDVVRVAPLGNRVMSACRRIL